jgi:thiopeptide-type bacteriocin biosynthesis protein
MTPSTPQSAASNNTWAYVKLYLGRAMDRMDRLLIAIGDEPLLKEHVRQWFYIRYVDERGVHIRLRALPLDGDHLALQRALVDLGARLLGELHAHPPGDYSPMVTAPGFELTLDRLSAAHNDVHVIEDVYQPETDKFGEGPAMELAERLFHESSRLAVRVLGEEERGTMSRKDLVPVLMAEVCRAFMPEEQAAEFWSEYSYYWLNGHSPAADDWRHTFGRKADELAQRGFAVLPDDAELDAPAREMLGQWRRSVQAAAAGYAALERRGGTKAEVLCFNFVHLMNNRLGLAALEEAYIATLLERAASREALAEAA